MARLKPRIVYVKDFFFVYCRNLYTALVLVQDYFTHLEPNRSVGGQTGVCGETQQIKWIALHVWPERDSNPQQQEF